MLSATALQEYQGAPLALGQSTGAMVAVGVGGLLVAGILGAAASGLVFGLAANSYKKHGDNPVRGGLTYGLGTLVTTLIGGGVAMGVTAAVSAKAVDKAAEASRASAESTNW
jgi:chromate transport protein ChrA